MSAYLTMLLAALVAGQPSEAAASPSPPTSAENPLVIRGKVVGPDGLPATDVFLSLASSGLQVTAKYESAVRPFCCREDCRERATVWKALAVGAVYACAKPDGTFELEVNERGTYKLFVQPARFLSEQVEVAAPGDGLEVKLKAGFSVSGQVVDVAGHRVEELEVRLERIGPAASRPDPRFPIRTRTAVTDVNGRFKAEGLVSGRYRICAQPESGAAGLADPRAKPCTELEVARDVEKVAVGPVPVHYVLPSPTERFGDYNLPGGPAKDPAVRDGK